jgi:Ca2+-binding RTX toxin-like protein
MAFGATNVQTDFRTVTFDLGGFANFLIQPGINLVISPAVYPGLPAPFVLADAAAWFSGSFNPLAATSAVFIGGTGLAAGPGPGYPILTAGTVTGFVFAENTAGLEFFALADVAVGAAALSAAATSAGTADDQALLRLMLGGNDTLRGSSFDDYIYTDAGRDSVEGGAGNDSLLGEAGNDTLLGGDGADLLGGGADNDLLYGGNLGDKIYGATGADTLNGGFGRDLLFGGADAQRDLFVFNAPGESRVGAATRDVVYDFVSGVDDIWLTGMDANTGVAGNQNFAFSAAGPAAHSVWLVAAGTGFLLRGDVNGGGADFEIQIVNIASMNAGDIVL